MSYKLLTPALAGLAILVAVLVATIVEIERDARRARQGRGGQSTPSFGPTPPVALPPRPSSPSGPPTGTVTARGGRFGPPPTDLPEPTPVLDDEIAQAARRLLALHRDG